MTAFAAPRLPARSAARSAQSVVCEGLEPRRQCAASAALDARFGAVTTSFGPSRGDFATAATTLADGRLLVAGVSVRTDYRPRTAFVLYNRDGTLAKGFNKTGTVVQSAEAMDRTGNVNGLVPLPDDSVLVVSDRVRRLKPDGTFDAGFGTAGSLPGQVFSPAVRAGGTIDAFEMLSTSRFRLRTYDARGHALRATTGVAGGPIRLANGLIASRTVDERLSLFTADLRPVATFGSAGTVNLKGLFDAWIAKSGPWYAPPDYGPGPAKGVPPYCLGDVTPTMDGGYLVSAVVSGFSARSTLVANGHETVVTVRLNAKGRASVVNGPAGGRVGIRFAASTSTFGGTFRFSTGTNVTLAGPAGGVYAITPAGDGGFYVVGSTKQHWTVARTAPVAARVGGTVFADANGDGVRGTTEAALAKRTVFLDVNANGRADPGEAVAVTDALGRYTFRDLGPGDYRVTPVRLSGERVTTPSVVHVATGRRVGVDLGTAHALALRSRAV